MVGGQVMIIYVGGKAFNVVRLNGAQWGYSIVLGVLSIPVGAVIRLIPDELLIRMIPAYLKRKPKGPELTISDEEQQFHFPKPLSDVKEELSFLKKVKGGRLNNLKFKMQDARDNWLPRSRSGSRSRSNSSLPQTPNNGEVQDDSFNTQPPQPTPESRKRGRSNRSRSNSALGATTVMAGIIAGSIAGWSPSKMTPSLRKTLTTLVYPLVKLQMSPHLLPAVARTHSRHQHENPPHEAVILILHILQRVF